MLTSGGFLCNRRCRERECHEEEGAQTKIKGARGWEGKEKEEGGGEGSRGGNGLDITASQIAEAAAAMQGDLSGGEGPPGRDALL